MSAIVRFTRPVDGSIPVPALLYDDEQLLSNQDGVGLYDGPTKSSPHQSGTVYLSTHRLFFIADSDYDETELGYTARRDGEDGRSLALDLSDVGLTESYAGFLMSSAKITLHFRDDGIHKFNTGSDTLEDSRISDRNKVNILAPEPHHPEMPLVTSDLAVPLSYPQTSTSPQQDSAFALWECEICGHKNPPGLSPAARASCALCGMPRTLSPSSGPSNSPAPNTNSDRSTAQDVKAAPSNIDTPPNILSRSLPSSSTTSPIPDPDESRQGTSRRRRRRPSTISCTACTFLNHPYLKDCEMCGTPLPVVPLNEDATTTNSALNSEVGLNKRPSIYFTSKSAPASRPTSPEPSHKFIKLSFRKGGDKAFYAALKTALQQKAWESHSKGLAWATRPVGEGSRDPQPISGINGILQNIDTTAQHTERGMSDAFSDLEALMSKAQDMVRLAKGLNEQLATATRIASSSGIDAQPIEPEEATFIRSSLGQLGLSMRHTAVTSDMTNDERRYLDQLAMELASVLQSGSESDERVGIMRKRGIIGLDEVWGGWNRARGVALVSPDVTLKVLPYLSQHTIPPISSRVLSSGLRVLHTPAYTIEAFSSRLIISLTNYETETNETTAVKSENGSHSTTEIASSESLSVGLIEELIAEVEERGDICRDDCRSGGLMHLSGTNGMAKEIDLEYNLYDGYF